MIYDGRSVWRRHRARIIVTSSLLVLGAALVGAAAVLGAGNMNAPWPVVVLAAVGCALEIFALVIAYGIR